MPASVRRRQMPPSRSVRSPSSNLGVFRLTLSSAAAIGQWLRLKTRSHAEFNGSIGVATEIDSARNEVVIRLEIPLDLAGTFVRCKQSRVEPVDLGAARFFF